MAYARKRKFVGRRRSKFRKKRYSKAISKIPRPMRSSYDGVIKRDITIVGMASAYLANECELNVTWAAGVTAPGIVSRIGLTQSPEFVKFRDMFGFYKIKGCRVTITPIKIMSSDGSAYYFDNAWSATLPDLPFAPITLPDARQLDDFKVHPSGHMKKWCAYENYSKKNGSANNAWILQG